MRYGLLILPQARWSVAREQWRAAEALGFDHAWTYDHLTWRSLRDRDWFASLPVLTAAATATERLRLGTLVTSPNFRHPVPLAKELMGLDDISGGRITVGIGAGGTGLCAVMSAAIRASCFVGPQQNAPAPGTRKTRGERSSDRARSRRSSVGSRSRCFST